MIFLGTTIVTDEWKGYARIRKMNKSYTHLTVNHSKEFVKKTNSIIHTQNIESLWQKFKRRHKEEFGTAQTTIDSHISEFIWRQEFGGNDCLYYIWNQIACDPRYKCER